MIKPGNIYINLIDRYMRPESVPQMEKAFPKPESHLKLNVRRWMKKISIPTEELISAFLKYLSSTRFAKIFKQACKSIRLKCKELNL